VAWEAWLRQVAWRGRVEAGGMARQVAWEGVVEAGGVARQS